MPRLPSQLRVGLNSTPTGLPTETPGSSQPLEDTAQTSEPDSKTTLTSTLVAQGQFLDHGTLGQE